MNSVVLGIHFSGEWMLGLTNVEWKLYFSVVVQISIVYHWGLRKVIASSKYPVIRICFEKKECWRNLLLNMKNSANFKYVSFFLVVYCRNNLIVYTVNNARLDNPTVTLPSLWRRRPIRHFHPGSRFFHFNSQYSTMSGDFQYIAQLVCNGAADAIILFRSSSVSQARTLLEGATWIQDTLLENLFLERESR